MNTLPQQIFDDGDYTEIQRQPDSSVITAMGKIAGFCAFAYVQDIDVKSGAVNTNAAAKIKNIYQMAVKTGAPIVAVFNSKGGDVGEGLSLADAYSDIIESVSRLSGVVPLISIIAGQCSGLNAVIARMSDFVIMTEDAKMFFTPPFIAADKLSDNAENSDSPQFNLETGAADIMTKNVEDAVIKARELLAILPANNLEPGFYGGLNPSDTVITEDLNSKELLAAIVDKDSLIEISGVTAFGVLNSQTLGFVTVDSQSAIDSCAVVKISRFVNFCDAFSIPVVTIIDSAGFEPSLKAEETGLIRKIAGLAQIYASATTPKISLLAGQAVGAAFVVLGGLKSDFTLAYESAVISPLPIKTAAAFLEIPEEEYTENNASVQNALKKGYVDLIISPNETRTALANAVDAVRNKRVAVPARKHINLAL